MKTALLLNGAAGSMGSSGTLAESRASELGWDVVHLEDRRASEVARQLALDGYGLVIAGGGDGTVRDVVQGLADASGRAALGVLPLGTGNDFARSLRMPLDVETALVALARAEEESRIAPIDILELTHGDKRTVCANSVNGGIAPLIREQMAPELKAKLGPLAFVWGALSSLTQLKRWPVRYRLDGGAEREAAFVAFVVANGATVGGGTQVAPTARVDDGQFDLVIIQGDASIAELTIAAVQAKFGDLFQSDCVAHTRARLLEILEQPGDLAFTADGEAVPGTLRSVRLLPGALRAIFGPDDEVPSTPSAAE